jgi:hypothetical protein
MMKNRVGADTSLRPTLSNGNNNNIDLAKLLFIFTQILLFGSAILILLGALLNSIVILSIAFVFVLLYIFIGMIFIIFIYN